MDKIDMTKIPVPLAIMKQNFDQICDSCGTPMDFSGVLMLLLREIDDRYLYQILSPFSCSSCHAPKMMYQAWKTMDVTQEMKVNA